MHSGIGRRWVIRGAIVSTAVGAIVSRLIPVLAGAGTHWWPSLQLVAYLLAAMAVAALVGFLFGVPRTRTETPVRAGSRPRRFETDSNLEQIRVLAR